MTGLWKDFQFAVRQFLQRPGFTLIAVVVLALGLGANAAIFSVVNAVLLQPLPYAHPETLVEVFERDVIGSNEESHYNWVSPGNFDDWRRDARSLASLSAVRFFSFNLSSSSESFTPQRVDGIASSANFLSVLSAAPALGRFLQPSEDTATAPYVAVLSYRFWQTRFAGSPKALGQLIRLDGNSYTIIGVLPQNFTFPGRPSDVIVSFERHLEPYNRGTHSNHFFQAIGRLAPGYTAAQAQAETSSILQNWRRGHPAEVMGKAATVVLLNRYLVRNIRFSLLVLLGAVGCLLLIACVNIANLLLTRALSRQRELAIRSAIGASRPQIVRQLLMESVLLSLFGAAAGLVVANWATSFLAAHAPGADRLPQTANIHIDLAVLAFTAAIALLSGVAAGFFPALSASRADLLNGLKDSSRSSTASRSQGKLRDLLVAVEVAVSLVLLVGAGLLLRSFFAMQSMSPGFHADNSISFAVSLPQASYRDRAAVSNFAQRLSDSLRSMPRVASAALVTFPPLAGHDSDSVYHIKGHPLPPGALMDLIDRNIDPGYFQALGIPLLKGRAFTVRDGVGFDRKHPRLGQAILSESAARKFFPNLDPVGQTLLLGSDVGLPPDPTGDPYPSYEIIGVVGDVPTDLEQGIEPTIYRPLFDGGDSDFFGIVHTSSNPEALSSGIQAAVHRLDPAIPVHHIRTFTQVNAEVTGDRRFSASLLGLFAAIALLLAATGLYGVVSQAVTQRTSEIGIRMALGASRGNVSWLILVDGLKPACFGIVAGILGSFALTRFLSSLLFHVSTADLVTFAAVPVLLAFVVVCACLIPALRATTIDPALTLRPE